MVFDSLLSTFALLTCSMYKLSSTYNKQALVRLKRCLLRMCLTQLTCKHDEKPGHWTVASVFGKCVSLPPYDMARAYCTACCYWSKWISSVYVFMQVSTYGGQRVAEDVFVNHIPLSLELHELTRFAVSKHTRSSFPASLVLELQTCTSAASFLYELYGSKPGFSCLYNKISPN